MWCPLSPRLDLCVIRSGNRSRLFQLVGVALRRREVCLLSSMCRKSEAKREDGGSAPVTLAVLCRSEGSRDSGEEVPLFVWSPQGVGVVVLSVLDGIGVPARALIPYVA